MYFDLHPEPVDLSALETLPPGLYQVDEPLKEMRCYDVVNECWGDGWCRKLARIDSELHLPVGVLEARIRADGKRVVVAYVLDGQFVAAQPELKED